LLRLKGKPWKGGFKAMWLPINPTLTDKGAWVSLAKLVGEDKAQPIKLAPGDDPLTSNFSVMVDQLSIAVAAKLAVGPIFGGSMGYDDRAFYLDASAFTEKYSEIPGSYVYATRWGIGLRVLLRVCNVKADMSLSFGMVAAAAQLGYAKAFYQIDGIGIGLDGLRIVLGEIHSFGDFTAETYYKINDSIIPKVAEYIKSNSASLKPKPFQVQVIQPIDIDPIVVAKSIMSAMKFIHEGNSLNEALSRYNADEIRMVYAKLVPNLGPNDKPPRVAQNAAGDWLSGK
jgi:hypothetical protein